MGNLSDGTYFVHKGIQAFAIVSSLVTYVEGVRNMPVIDFIVNVLSTPAILVGLVALLGLVLPEETD